MFTLIELQLRILGLEPLLASRPWWTRVGIRRFLRDWPYLPAGSRGELTLLLGLLDPQVQVRFADRRALASRRGHSIKIEFSRRRLLKAGRPVREFCRRAVAWWSGPQCGEIRPDEDVAKTLAIGWRGSPLAVIASLSRNEAQPKESTMIEYPPQIWLDYARLHGVRRRKALPARVLLAASVEHAATLQPGQLVVTDRETSVFFANSRTVRLGWKCASGPALTTNSPSLSGTTELAADRLGQWRFVALCDGQRWLDFTMDPEDADQLQFSIDGAVVKAKMSRRWPQWIRLPLSQPSQEGRVICLTARTRTTENSIAGSAERRLEPLKLRLNPFESRRVALDAARGAGWIEEHSPLTGRPAPLVHPVAGHQELTRVEQASRLRAPQPVEPLESVLARLRKKLTKRWRNAADLRTWIAAQLQVSAQEVDCHFSSWLDSDPSKSPFPTRKYGWTVSLKATTASNGEGLSQGERIAVIARLTSDFAAPDCAVRVIESRDS